MRGFLLLDKPPGVTSSKVLEPFRRMLRRRAKVGHAGTLDPFATGALLVLLGDVTRLSDLAMALPKTYVGTVRFGEATDTLDPEGEVTETADPGDRAPDGFEAAVASFRGEIEQVPPAYSAIKIGGRAAYRLARAGEAPEMKSRRVHVHTIECVELTWPTATLHIRCSAGTYVRSIARDLGIALGLPAHLASLRRTHIGPFAAADGITLEAGADPLTVEPKVREALRDPIELVEAAGLTQVELDTHEAYLVASGCRVPMPNHDEVGRSDGNIAVTTRDADGELTLVALARSEPTREIRPTTVLSSAREELERMRSEDAGVPSTAHGDDTELGSAPTDGTSRS